MNSIELIDKKEQLQLKAQNIINQGKHESRKLTTDEEREYNDLCKQIADTENEIRQLNQKLNKKETMKKETFSLLKAVRAIANNQQLDERSQQVVNAGIAEMRKSGQSYSGQIILPVEERADVQATVADHGQEIVAEDKLNILAPLRDKLVLSAAGANYMTGLVGNVNIPVYSGGNVGWAGEIEAASNGQGTFTEINLERLSTGLPCLDRKAGAYIGLSYYEMQMVRIAGGKPVKLTKNAWRPLCFAFHTQGWSVLMPQRAQRWHGHYLRQISIFNLERG